MRSMQRNGNDVLKVKDTLQYYVVYRRSFHCLKRRQPPEYHFALSLVAGDESEGEVVGIGGGAQSFEATRFVVPVWSPRPPGGRGGFQGVSEASSVKGATTQPVDPLVAP